MNIYPLRLKPNQDLRQQLVDFALDRQILAGLILTACGSLKQAAIRFADCEACSIITDKFEIIALNGIVAFSGVHLHILISDRQGQTMGGHLDFGCLIYTTAEIIIGASDEFRFLRTFDPQTGYRELEIIQNSRQDA